MTQIAIIVAIKQIFVIFVIPVRLPVYNVIVIPLCGVKWKYETSWMDSPLRSYYNTECMLIVRIVFSRRSCLKWSVSIVTYISSDKQ